LLGGLPDLALVLLDHPLVAVDLPKGVSVSHLSKTPKMVSALLVVMAAMLVVHVPPALAQQPGDTCSDLGGGLQACTRITPQSDTKPVGSSHTVTADTFLLFGGTEAPILRLGTFTITSGPDAGLISVCAFTCSFTFTNNGNPGTDTILFDPVVPGFAFPNDTATVTFDAPTPPTPPAPGQQQPDQQQGVPGLEITRSLSRKPRAGISTSRLR
jgi:hypothetical protein